MFDIYLFSVKPIGGAVLSGRIFISAELGVRQSSQVAHAHNCAELFVSLEGRTTDVVNGQESKTLPLDVFVLTRDVIHGQINTADYRYCIFKFDMDALIARLGADALDGGFQSIFVIDPSLRRDGGYGTNMRIDSLTAEYAETVAKILCREGCCSASDEIFVALVLAICKNARARDDGGGSREAVAEAVLYMNTRYSEHISLELLASRSGYSPRHFARIFSSMVGVSPMKYLGDVRLRRAAVLLSENIMSVTEIAAAVGIVDSSQFTKSFRSKFGLTPTEYKKSL